MKYYKIVYGFNPDDHLPIKGDELPKAIALFVEKIGRGVFEDGVIRGQDIMRIIPDWHRVKGWNKGYKMNSDDNADVAPLEEGYRNVYNKAKEIAEYAIKENRRDLLLKPSSEAIKELPQGEIPRQISEEVKKLADKFKNNDP